MNKLSLGVLISGRGSNLHALIKKNNSKISCVVASRLCPGVDIAKQYNIPVYVVKKDLSFEKQIHKLLVEHDVDIVCLAGFMHLLSKSFIDLWPNKIINMHPSLLPSFKGLSPHIQALDSGVKVSGCTVHFVVPQVDSGEIIVQGVVPVKDKDTLNELSDRILQVEHICYPRAIDILSGKNYSNYVACFFDFDFQ